MNSSEDKKIWEQYEEVAQSQNEGMWDRAKVRGAGLGAGLKKIGRNVATRARGAWAGVRGDQDGLSRAQSELDAHDRDTSVEYAQIEQFKNIVRQKLSALHDELSNDAKVLGLGKKDEEVDIGNYIKGAMTQLDTYITRQQNKTTAPSPQKLGDGGVSAQMDQYFDK